MTRSKTWNQRKTNTDLRLSFIRNIKARQLELELVTVTTLSNISVSLCHSKYHRQQSLILTGKTNNQL